MFKDDLQKSQKYFRSIKPILEAETNSKIVEVEGQNNALKSLDLYAGIDYLLIDDKGVRGIASRIQEGPCYRTFTIRVSKKSGAKTEFEKRIDAFADNYIYPYYTLQAYADNDKIIYAVCRTTDLYKFVFENPEKVQVRTTTNASFFVVNWSDIPCSVKMLVRVNH